MTLFSKSNGLIIALFFVCHTISAQSNVAEMKHKKCMLKGKWQLVKTYANSAFHDVDKAEYDAVILFKAFHHYSEEVHYEGYHWIIEGRWQVYKHRATLALTKRTYTLGKLGDIPQDITYELLELSKQGWKAKSIAAEQPVQMHYTKIAKRKK